MKKLTDKMKTLRDRRRAAKAKADALHDNPGYIEINMGANRHERRSAAAMNRKFDRAS